MQVLQLTKQFFRTSTWKFQLLHTGRIYEKYHKTYCLGKFPGASRVFDGCSIILSCLLLAQDFECDGKTASDLNREVVEVKCLYSCTWFDVGDTGPATRRIRDDQRKIQGVRSMSVLLVRQVPIILGSDLRPGLQALRDNRASTDTIGDIEEDKRYTWYQYKIKDTLSLLL